MNKRIKKNFLRKILNACLKNKNYATVVFHATFPLDDLKEFIDELKEEFLIKNIIIEDFDWRVKYITENINETPLKKMPEPAMWLVILLIDLFLLNFIICSLVLIFKYKLEYFVVAVGIIVFCSFGIWYSIKYYINNIKMKYNLMDTNNPLDKLIEFIDNKKNKE